MPRIRRLLILLLTLWLVPRAGNAAMPVQEVGPNLLYNTIQATNAVAMVVNQGLELMSLEQSALDDLHGELDAFVRLIERAQGLIPFDPARTRAVFDELYPPAAQVPCTTTALNQWQDRWAEQRRLSLAHSMEAQGLLHDLGMTSQRIMALVSGILRTIGNLQGLQIIQQQQAILQGEQLRLVTMTGIFQRAVDSKEAAQVTTEAAIKCIYQRLMADHPR